MTTRVLVSKDNKATLTCPQCGKSKTVDVSKHMQGKGSATVTYHFQCSHCACGHADCTDCPQADCHYGHTNVINLERREYYRKKVRLPGYLTNVEKKRVPVTILDLSMTGLLIFCADPMTTKLTVDAPILVEFRLPDEDDTHIRKKCIIKKVDGSDIGAEFIAFHENSPYYDALLMFMMT